VTTLFFISCSLIFVINVVYFIIQEKGLLEREKFTSYECGFEAKAKRRIPFRLRFFLLTIIYLLFDIEILIAFRYVYKIYYFRNHVHFHPSIISCSLTLYLEWIEGGSD